ncbi:MAG: Alanine racemase [Candidatus Nomurabacteria bacterium GW2011_GWA1_37_20]|uniref:Alanine racemase n=2 Tax=Parcubacteria group TaxID=1794811 RepID=A0A0G0KET3_9BACT|nr:MAG: Alanine racemase [Parcubacteria group bacterium GW2011_GWC1_36_9]KKQ26074.1 MAG: Alanine racemase [Parcubacteria group bacterium GW2011_GWB1_37_13]KKQ30002.1 MAG: Alanine racemase [Candidatus Nomurabacteria bacterium GW2011_GWA1_37_20]KKQ47664.1 MAG: Alanine racemase [Candidatus Yanofskybacteria bacterium GW2011_GWC2_37_9]
MLKKNLFLSHIEISKKNLIHNIKQFRNLAKKGTKISIAIKGNAYGHGQNEIAKILEPYADYFQVNSVGELELLRKISKKKTLILGYIKSSDLLSAIKLGSIIAVFSVEQLDEINKISKKIKKMQEIYVPIDAYLGREGFLTSELPKFLKKIKKYEYVKLSGIYAHFANIEDTRDFSHAQKQIKEYVKALELAHKFGFKNLDTHISATSGLLVYEKNLGIYSIIRLGIGVYGMWPSEDIKKMYKNKIELRSVLSWKTKVAQVKVLSKGSTVGYGLTYVTKKKTKIAVIPQGYADGLDRGLSNNGEILIGGTRCKIIGRVSMNMFVADVDHLSNVKAEDEVVIIGAQNGEQITVEEIAKKLNTINYEITTRISSLLPRIII